VPRDLAIVDYGMGNLFSVANACARVGAPARLASRPEELLSASGVILPGVGAMPDAMHALRETGLGAAIVEAAARGTPILGICLGLQLLMREGTEFERHAGLGLVDGDVVRLDGLDELGRPLRIPHLGWNAVHAARPWGATDLADVASGAGMYFVHSYHVRPADRAVVLAETRCGDAVFCSVVQTGSILACQFHPERSAALGLGIFRRFAARAGLVALPQESAA
jgi:glutamine amidotransferase